LLLLRGVLALVVLAEARFYLNRPDATAAGWSMGLTGLLAGGLLLVGYLTPIVAAVLVMATAAVSVGLLPGCAPSLFDSRITIVFGLTMLLAILGLGPGAFSVDARLFGRREIIIPPPSHLARGSE